MVSEVCTSIPFDSIVGWKHHSKFYIRHLSHRSMNESDFFFYKTFGNIEHKCDKRTGLGEGAWGGKLFLYL